jgi:hypothetical protein
MAHSMQAKKILPVCGDVQCDQNASNSSQSKHAYFWV